MSRPADVVVVGAGVVGCGAARELAPDHDVVVVERGRPAGEATGLSGGVVSPGTFYPDTPSVAVAALEFYEVYDGTRGFRFQRQPWLDLVTEAEAPGFRERAETLADAGLDVAFLEPEALADAYPQLAVSRFGGALEHREAGWVDPYAFATSLLEDARDSGARVELETAVEAVRVEDDAIHGVETTDGIVDADHVVVAAGWRTPALIEELVDLPIRPWEFAIATLEPAAELGAGFPAGLSVDDGVYFRPEGNGDLLVGNGDRPARDPARKSGGVDADAAFRESVAAFVPSVLPGQADATLTNHWTGIEGITPDARPIVDAVGPEGLIVAQASAIGIMTGPPIARAVRALVTGEAVSFPLSRFALGRFDGGRSEFYADGMVGGSG